MAPGYGPQIREISFKKIFQKAFLATQLGSTGGESELTWTIVSYRSLEGLKDTNYH